MKVLKTITVSVLTCLALSKTLSAQECVNIEKLDISWTSFKTLEKIGVSGNFKDIQINGDKNSSNLKELLLNIDVDLKMSDLDAHAEVKNSAIKKYFVNNLSTKKVNAKVLNMYSDSLDLQIELNGVTKTIPMKYMTKDNQIKAKGVIDALDFGLASALRVLNTSVAGHLNKGWYDIPISFDLKYINKCM